MTTPSQHVPTASEKVPDGNRAVPVQSLALTQPLPNPLPGFSQSAIRLEDHPSVSESTFVRGLWILLAFALFAVVIALPLVLVFVEAFRQGVTVFWEALRDPDTRSAVSLSLTAAAIAVPVNVLFGVAAAWAVTRFRFRGRSLVVTLIDLPFSVSPVVAGLMLVLLFGSQGWWGHWLQQHDLKVLYALPGIVLATVFVTLPFVARELISLMETQGRDAEEAAMTLGASGWQLFWHVTLPSIKWALLTGILLCNARALGEFGAVSVVSGHIRGQTNTLPLHVEVLYNDYHFSAAFAVASLLAMTAVLTLGIKTLIESKHSWAGH